MTGKFLLFVCLILVTAIAPGMVLGQSGRASATPVNISTGTPSTIAIREQFLVQQEQIIERELQQVTRCIANASLNVVLVDPTGIINRVPQTDIVNCTRRLNQLQRQVARLAREAQQLANDAQVQATALETQARLAELQQNLRALSSGTTAGGTSSALGGTAR